MPKVLYIIPTGSNPSGTILPEARRKQIYELSCKYDFIILEDDPYMFLNYTDVSSMYKKNLYMIEKIYL